MIPIHWNEEIRLVVMSAKHHAECHRANAVIGITVDDNRKRDHFAAQLQAVLNENDWAKDLTFRIVPINGEYIDLKRK